MEKQWKHWETLFSWAPKLLQMVTAALKFKDACPWKKSYDKPRQFIKKQRHYFANEGLSSQSYVLFCFVLFCFFPVVMYRCVNWTIKNAEYPRIDAFGLWCWRRLLRVPWAASRSNRSIIKEISSDYSLEGLMLKLKLLHFGHLMQRADTVLMGPWCLERLRAGGEGDNRGWDGWMASPTR